MTPNPNGWEFDQRPGWSLAVGFSQCQPSMFCCHICDRGKTTDTCLHARTSACHFSFQETRFWDVPNRTVFAYLSWKKTLHIRDHLPSVTFDHKHHIRFLLSVLSVAVDGPPVTDVTGEQYICLAIAFAFSFLFRRKGKLVHSLVPVVHSLGGQDHRPTCRQEEQSHPIQLLRKQ